MKKNKMIALVTTMTIAMVSLIALGTNKNFSSFKLFGYNQEEVDCERYFDYKNDYTSLYEIVENLNSGTTDVEYKTWGTVTKFFLGTSNQKNFYIQSSDRYGRTAGFLVYNSPISFQEGNVITIMGVPILYDNIPEFLNPDISDITLDYTTNNYPVETYETDSSFWKNSDDSYSSEFINAQTMGARKISVDDVALEYVSSGNGRAYFSDGTTVTLYFASIKNTSAITNYLNSLNGRQSKITGILHSRIKSGVAQLTLLIRDASDIVPLGGGQVDNELTINGSTANLSGSYSTGNYGNSYVGGYRFEYYRTVNSYIGFVDILPNFESNNTTAPGAIYNIDPIVGMTNISITYLTSGSSGSLPLLEFGENELNNSVFLPLSTYSKTISYEVESSNYFKISTSESTLTIEEIVIDYTNTSSGSTSFIYEGSGNDEHRINPSTYIGTLFEGLTVSVPSSVSRSGDNYIVNSYKTYTYYSTSYIENNPSFAEEAAQIDPIDVATYYTIFKTAPANYVEKSYYNTAYYTFGENTRCVSFYTRTDGYATAVPYRAIDRDMYGNLIPRYYELDIALSSSYSASNRGVGRVVAWENGFDTLKGAAGYDTSPVCVYTDDHYFSFQEYLNTGTFGKRFNAQGAYTSYVWGVRTTLIP